MPTRIIKDEKGQDVIVTMTDKGKSWRMVHDGRECKCLMESIGITTTKFTLFTAPTLNECIAEGERLGLSNISECAMQCTKEQLVESLRGIKGVNQVDYLLKAIADSGADISQIAASVSSQVEAAKSQIGGGLAKP